MFERGETMVLSPAVGAGSGRGAAHPPSTALGGGRRVKGPARLALGEEAVCGWCEHVTQALQDAVALGSQGHQAENLLPTCGEDRRAR